MKKIVTVVGARPQFIKASVVSREIARSDYLTEVLVHTGQHFDANMSDVFFEELGIDRPIHQLNIHGGTHGEMTGKMLAAVEAVFLAESPDAVLVYGDTNSTLAGALAAVKLHYPVAHVESGLRSFNMAMPEEVNRILTDRISSWLYAPTETAVRNLLNEGVAPEKIVAVGDVMYDVALHYGDKVSESGRVLGSLGLSAKDYVLATIHRAENTDDTETLGAIAEAMQLVAEQKIVVWPMHPRTRSILDQMGRLKHLIERLHVIDPVGYLDMVQLEKYASVIATDSGGVQKEAFFHRVPCVTLRKETEWIELLDSGWNELVASSSSRVIAAAILAADNRIGGAVQPYGDGTAAAKIVSHLRSNVDGR